MNITEQDRYTSHKRHTDRLKETGDLKLEDYDGQDSEGEILELVRGSKNFYLNDKVESIEVAQENEDLKLEDSHKQDSEAEILPLLRRIENFYLDDELESVEVNQDSGLHFEQS
ncbi:hypothetical protein O181_063727 [Austropuccinia psidii MF-1]|uniref:Uncharacterized protein n=1 Tax=Austropuccinia psidii MF-1 TaxID=1389203 RepID=A0A9Q3EUF7_9BASI|nr:hypothetical protein [Austropuccinia psidii MF-1]